LSEQITGIVDLWFYGSNRLTNIFYLSLSVNFV